jgi:hemerythrin-like metal-binding protein
MVRFKWSNQQAVFLPEIDAEHRGMMRTADDLQNAVLAQADDARVLAGVRNLVAQAEEHFAHEERLMKNVRYSSLPWHKQQHDTFRRRARRLLPSIEAGDREPLVELLDFLHAWFKDHTAVADRMMGAYLRNYERARTRLAS